MARPDNRAVDHLYAVWTGFAGVEIIGDRLPDPRNASVVRKPSSRSPDRRRAGSRNIHSACDTSLRSRVVFEGETILNQILACRKAGFVNTTQQA